ncbi:hypothetical protein Tco_0603387 [Tanacetum coccineum]
MVRSNRSDGYASIVASEQRAELCSRIGTLKRDNMRLRGILGVERQRVDRLWRSTIMMQKEKAIAYDSRQLKLAKAKVAADALSRKERAKPLRVGALVMTINLNFPPQIHEAQIEALKKENVKNENLPGTNKDFKTHLDRTLCIRSRNCRHRHLYQQVLDVFKDEGRLSEAIWVTGTTRNTPLEMGKYSHGFYNKPVKDNKLLLHDLGNRVHQKNYADVRRKPLEFQVRAIFVERSDAFWQMGKSGPYIY